MNGDLQRLVDSIHRDKDIDKDIIYEALEDALLSAARKHYGPKSDIAVFVDRESGAIEAFDGNQEIDAVDIGRIAAQTAKQVIIQKIRDAEQDVIFRDYESRLKQIVSGTIQRFEGSTLVVNLGRCEAIVPRSEQVPEEGYRIGDRIRAFLLDVKRVGTRVRILLSRSHPDFIRRLFELEVPEISERVIEIMAIAREPGYRTKVAVASADAKVDAVGACVGVRGSRIKNVVAELNDEKIDIVRWSDSRDMLIANALKPAEVREVAVVNEYNRARVTVPEEELSLAIGKRGRNVRLAAKLCEVDIDVLSEAEADRELDDVLRALDGVENVPDRFAQRVFQMGYSIEDIAEGATGWVERFDIDEETSEIVYERTRVAAEENAAARAAAAAAAALAPPEETAQAGGTPAEQKDQQKLDGRPTESQLSAGVEGLMASAAEEEAEVGMSLEEAFGRASALDAAAEKRQGAPDDTPQDEEAADEAPEVDETASGDEEPTEDDPAPEGDEPDDDAPQDEESADEAPEVDETASTDEEPTEDDPTPEGDEPNTEPDVPADSGDEEKTEM